jgi:hypothetical protein
VLKLGSNEIQLHIECVASPGEVLFELTGCLDQDRAALVFGHDIQTHPLGIITSPQDRGEAIVISDKHESADRGVDPFAHESLYRASASVSHVPALLQFILPKPARDFCLIG